MRRNRLRTGDSQNGRRRAKRPERVDRRAVRSTLETVNWTVDVPIDALPELPPLPADLRTRLDDALAQPAAQQPELAGRRTVGQACARCWRACRRSRVPPEVDRLQRPAGRRRPRRGVPAAGRRLRRDVRRQHRAAHPGQHPHAAADGGRADLRREHAGGQGRPDRRPVRQAARRPTSTRWACRPTAATWSTRSPPTPRRAIHDPSRHDARLRQRQRGDEPGARADRRRAWPTCTLVHDWNREFVRTSPAGARYEALAAEIDRGAAVHERLRGRRPQPAHRRDLRQPRGAGARLRARDAAARRDDPDEPAALRPVGALRVDRRAHPPARRRAHRVRRADRQPDRRQDRPDDDAGAGRRVRRAARPATTSRAG